MKKWCSLCAMALLAATSFAAVERVEYSSASRVQQRERDQERTRYEIAGFSPVALGIMPACGLPDANHVVGGLRLNLLVGEHVDVYGLDLGLVGNLVRREGCGVQVAPFFNRVGESDGLVQFSFFNQSEGPFRGVQAGGVNSVESGAGAQIGLFNRAGRFCGLQLGVLNIVSDSWLPVWPLLHFAY